MIDLHILRTDPDRVRESQTRRGEDPNLVDAAVAADSAHRAALTDFERLRAEQKDLGRQVAAADADTARTAGTDQGTVRTGQTGRAHVRGPRRPSTAPSSHCRTWSMSRRPWAERRTSPSSTSGDTA